MFLARHQAGGPVRIATLAEREGMPRKFLERILLELNREGLLQSKKGKGGGYSLRMSPDKIRMSDVLRIVDGPLSLDSGGEPGDVYAIRAVLERVRQATVDILDGTTLTDMLEMGKEGHEALHFVI